MNQAFGSPLQCLPATPLDSNSDSDSLASTPDEGVSCAPFPGVPSTPIHIQQKEIIRKGHTFMRSLFDLSLQCLYYVSLHLIRSNCTSP